MMMRGIAAVFVFEWRRAFSGPRIFSWCLLAAFPPGLGALVRHYTPADDWPPPFVVGSILFGLIVEVLCLLGLLLSATPLLHAELESRSWPYLAVRPAGRLKVMLGKYLAAVSWTYSIALAATILTVVFVAPVHATRLGLNLALLSLFSCLTYGALYCLIAVVMHRRAMVFAVAYTVVFEFLVTFIPAVINQVTIQFRLRSLLFHGMGWLDELPDDVEIIISPAPAWLHVMLLIGMTAALLVAAGFVVSNKQYIVSDEA